MVASIHQAAEASYYLSCMRSYRLPLESEEELSILAAGQSTIQIPGQTGVLAPGAGPGGSSQVPGQFAVPAPGALASGSAPLSGGPLGGGGGGGAPSQYYLGGEEPDGRWWNPHGLFDLQDEATIEIAGFRRLYQGFSPDGSERLTRNAGSPDRSAGLDVVFSADKTASVLWLMSDPELRERIEGVHHRAVRDALAHVYDGNCAYTRRGLNGKEVVPAQILGATFQHGATRENEPQLHTHAVIFNVALAEDDGKWRALHQKPFHYWIKAAGAVYRNALAFGLRRELGVEIERHGERGEFVRVAGVPEELCEDWSTRRRQILSAARELGFNVSTGGARTAAIVLTTRKSKPSDGDPDARIERWRKEMAGWGYDRETILAEAVGRMQELSAAERAQELQALITACADVPDHLTANEAVFRMPDILRRVAELSAGGVDTAALQTLVARVLRHETVLRMEAADPTAEGRAGMAHTAVWSNRHEVTQEIEVADLARSLAERPGAAIAPASLDLTVAKPGESAAPLSEEQVAAVRHVCASGSIAVVEGAAGSGKSVTLRPVADLHREAGYRVIAAAVAWRAALETGADCDARPFAIEKLLRAAAKGQVALDDRTLLIVDEAGMLPVRSMHRLLSLVEQSGAKLVLTGDTQQLQPIEAGPGLRLVTDAIGSIRVDEIRRQRADLEDLVAWRDGVGREDALLRAGLMPEAERETLLESRDDFEGETWQAEASRALKDRRAGEAIAAYAQRGRFHLCADHGDTLRRLVGDWMTHWRDSPGESRLALARTNREVSELSTQLRIAVMSERADAGESVDSVSVRTAGVTQGARMRQLEIAPGDLLRIGATCWKRGLFNGSIVEVESAVEEIDPETGQSRVRVAGRTQQGRETMFFADEIVDWWGRVRLDYGYALTIAAAQGTTADRAFLWTDDRPARETIYPAATRHRDRLDWYLNRRLLAVTVTESLPEDRHGTPVRDEEIHSYLARLWSRQGPKVAALDHASWSQRRKLEADAAEKRRREERARFASWLRGPVPGAEPDGGREVLHSAIEQITRWQSVFSRADIESALRRLDVPEESIATEAERLLTDPRVLPLYGGDPSEARRPLYTTVAVWAEERTLANYASKLEAARSTVPASWRARALRRTLERHGLVGSEALLAERIAAGEGLAIARTVEGGARERAIAAAADAGADAGGEVWALAPDNAGFAAFEGNVRRRMTVRHFLQALSSGRIRLARESVAIVAGAGALDNTTILSLLKAADEAGFRVALTDDTRLAPGPGRAEAWQWLAERADPDGGHSAIELPGHLPEDDHAPLRLAVQGDWPGSMAALDAADRVRIFADQEAVHGAIAEDWARNPPAIGESRFAITAGRADALALSATIQAARHAAGHLGPAVDVRLPEGDETLRVHVGDRVRIRRSESGVSAGATGIVTAATEKRLAVDFDGETVLLDPRSPPPLELGYAIGLHAARHRVADQVDVAVAPGWNTRSLYTALSRHRQQVTLYAQAERTPDARSIGVIASRQAERPFSRDRMTRWEALDSSAPGQTAEVLRGAWRRLQEDDRAQLEERDRVAREAAGGVQHALEDRVEAWISANDNRQGAIRRLAAGMREARSVAKMSVPATIHAGKTEENQARWRALRREARTTGIPLRDLAGYAEVAARMQRLGAAAGELLEAGTDAAAAIRAHGGRTLGDLTRQREEALREQDAAAAWRAGGEDREIRALADAWKEAREESLDLRARLRANAMRQHRRFFFAAGYGEWLDSVRELDALAERLQDAGESAETALGDHGSLVRVAKARKRFAGWLGKDARERDAAEQARRYAARSVQAEGGDGSEQEDAARRMTADRRFFGPHLRAAGVDPNEVARLGRLRSARTEEWQRKRLELEARGPEGWAGMNPDQRREWVQRLSADLAIRAPEVCARFLSGGRRDGRYWTAGNVSGEAGDSLKVHLEGPRTGKWRDFATGEHGDLLDLFKMRHTEAIDAYAEATKFTNTPPVETPEQIQDRSARRAERSAEADHEARRKSQAARNLWNHRLAIDELQGTPVDLYLAGRGIQGASRWESLRFHPSAWLQAGDARHELPAMVAAVSDNEGKVQAVHRTFLEKDGETWDKASRLTDKPRWMLGPTLGYGVRFGTLRDDGVLVVGEGIETVLSVLEFRSELPGVACGSAAHLAGFEPPEETRRLFIAADRGEAGMNAADQLQERCKERGIEVIVAPPPEGMNDWNDALQELGREETKAAVDQVFKQAIGRQLARVPEPPDSAETVRQYAESYARYRSLANEMLAHIGTPGADEEFRAARDNMARMAGELDRAAALILASGEGVLEHLADHSLSAEEIERHRKNDYRITLEGERKRLKERQKIAERTARETAAQVGFEEKPQNPAEFVKQYAEDHARYRNLATRMLAHLETSGAEAEFRAARDLMVTLARRLDRSAARILASREDMLVHLPDHSLSAEDIERHRENDYGITLEGERRRQQDRQKLAQRTTQANVAQVETEEAPRNLSLFVKEYAADRARYRSLSTEMLAHLEIPGAEAKFRAARDSMAKMAQELDKSAARILASGKDVLVHLQDHSLSAKDIERHRDDDYRITLEGERKRRLERQHHANRERQQRDSD